MTATTLCIVPRICSHRSTHTYAASFFFFNDTATTEIYTLSLHDALPISAGGRSWHRPHWWPCCHRRGRTAPSGAWGGGDRKSTRLNSSHLVISYAVFCLKKKKKLNRLYTTTRRSSFYTSNVVSMRAVCVA